MPKSSNEIIMLNIIWLYFYRASGILKYCVKSCEFYFTLWSNFHMLGHDRKETQGETKKFRYVYSANNTCHSSKAWFGILKCRMRCERCDSSSWSSLNLASIIIPNTAIRFSELPALSRHLSIFFWNSLRSGYSFNRRSRSLRAVLPISINSCLLTVLFFLFKLKRFPMVLILSRNHANAFVKHNYINIKQLCFLMWTKY